MEREYLNNHYIKVNAYNARYTKQTVGLSFIVNRPTLESGFRLDPHRGERPHTSLHVALVHR